MLRVPLPMAEVWAELQAQVEELTGQAGLQILQAMLENDATIAAGRAFLLIFLATCKTNESEVGKNNI
jgi:hypothetical protein